MNLQEDFWLKIPLPKDRTHAPFVRSSATSQEAAERIVEGPAFAGNKSTCLKEIAKWNNRGGVTRKQIAQQHFSGFQNHVTGPVLQLIQEGLVYEEAARDRDGRIMEKKGKVVRRRIDHSAVLLLTPRGKAATV